MPAFKLQTAATSSGPGTAYAWYGGIGTVHVDGLGTGAVNIQGAVASSTGPYENLGSDTNFTADGMANFQFGGDWVRADITTASSTGVTIWVNS